MPPSLRNSLSPLPSCASSPSHTPQSSLLNQLKMYLLCHYGSLLTLCWFSISRNALPGPKSKYPCDWTLLTSPYSPHSAPHHLSGPETFPDWAKLHPHPSQAVAHSFLCLETFFSSCQSLLKKYLPQDLCTLALAPHHFSWITVLFVTCLTFISLALGLTFHSPTPGTELRTWNSVNPGLVQRMTVCLCVVRDALGV